MESGTLGEVSTYLQPDLFESRGKKMNGLLGQNPLLLLARTCQNIGNETKTTDFHKPSISIGNPSVSTSKFLGNSNGHHIVSSKIDGSFKKPIQTSQFQTLPTNYLNAVSSNISTTHNRVVYSKNQLLTSTSSQQSIANDVKNNSSTSSNSLVQLARLSSNLKFTADRQKRSRIVDSNSKQQLNRHKRTRRQSFAQINESSMINVSKPIDFTLLNNQIFSTSSTSSNSSSVSPSSLRSTPPTHSSSPPSLQLMKNLLDLTSTSPNCLQTFYAVGNALGAPHERLRELLISVAQALMERTEVHEPDFPVVSTLINNNSATSNHRLVDPTTPNACSDSNRTINNSNTPADPSTQCLYCGIVCEDMNRLVNHIYTHLASLHSQSKGQEIKSSQPVQSMHQPIITIPPNSTRFLGPNSFVNPLFDIASNYARFLNKAPQASESNNVTSNLGVHNPSLLSDTTSSSMTVDQNALFLAWLNIFRSGYNESLEGENHHRPS